MESLARDESRCSTLAGGPLVSVVMPCLDEERTVGACVRKALNALADMGLPGEVVVSDNGSMDNSVAVAERAGARVVHCPDRGYGSAVRFGVEHARGNLVVLGDSDGSYDFSTIEKFIRPLVDGADLVMGNRFLGGIRPGAMPWKNRYLGNPALNGLLNLFFHVGIGDSHCGLRAFSRAAFERMQLECPGMELASEMVVKAAKRHLRIVEVPTTLDPDGRNRPPHLAPWRDGWRHLKFLLMSAAHCTCSSSRERSSSPSACWRSCSRWAASIASPAFTSTFTGWYSGSCWWSWASRWSSRGSSPGFTR